MKYLSREEINEEAWDECISLSKNGLFYGLSWVLDSLTEKWDGIVWESEGSYSAVFPIPWKKKAQIKYVYPPFFIQQLGVFSKEDDCALKTKEALKLLNSKFRFIELNLNSYSNKGEVKRNLILKLNKDYSSLYSSFSGSHKRNLKKAQKSKPIVKSSVEVNEIVELFNLNKGAELKVFSLQDYKRFLGFCELAKKKGLLKTKGIYNGNSLICGCVFIQFKSRIIFLFSGNSNLGKQQGSMLCLLNNTIESFQNSGFVLDFEGSENEGLSRFYKGFGSEEENYFFYKRNRLPMILKWIKR